jgi:excisionase family DNA binding protein
MDEDRIGLKQAAEKLGVSKDTLWRAIRRDELEAERDHGPSGTQYWLSYQAVLEWWEHRKDRKRMDDAPDPEQTIIGRVAVEFPPQASQESQAHDASLATPGVEVLAAPAAQATVPVEVHLQALRLVERAQIQVESMRYELHCNRQALTEQAESLLEKEALTRQTEALRNENLRNQAMWQSEKAQLIGELSHHRDRVNWLEKRVPRWVRGLFGAK